MNKKLFISSDFLLQDYLWILPIFDGYNKKKNINEIIFEDQIDIKALEKNINIKNILKKYKITFLKKNWLNKKNILTVLKFLTNFFFTIIFLNVNSFGKILKEKKVSWYNIQIYHAYWDMVHRDLKSHQTKPNFIKKILIINRIIKMIAYSNFILKCQVSEILLGHSVYSRRVLLANLREKKINIFVHANYSLYRTTKYFDRGWHTPDLNFIKVLRRRKLNKLINYYWNIRMQGKGNYEDAIIAAKKNSLNSAASYNILFLHIFRDSPFNIIDTSRIFIDYYDWVFNTLKILKNSKEDWIIKFHPNNKRWGENQKEILDIIIKKIFDDKIPKNILLDIKEISNLELLKKAKKIITFSGTVHLESACFGIKPITISTTTLSNLSAKMVFKPKNINEYQKLLLSNNSKIFRLSRRQINLAKFFLYIRENVLKFNIDISAKNIYLNDSLRLKQINFNKINSKISTNKQYLNEMGEKLANGLKNSVSKKFINYFN